MAGIEKDQYNTHASLYDEIETLPQSSIHHQLVELALLDCSGKTVLDLGGGSGLHARRAVDMGARLVDNIDVSPGMLQMGKNTATKLGRDDPIRWLVGDIMVPLRDLPPEKEYDIVMVNWTFDHCQTVDELEMAWHNAAKYTKKGGKLISLRMKNARAESCKTGQYGYTFTDVEEIPGGVKYIFHAATTPKVSIPASTLYDSCVFEKSKLMAGRHGFTDFQKVPVEELQVVKADPTYWKCFLDDPVLICVTATKV